MKNNDVQVKPLLDPVIKNTETDKKLTAPISFTQLGNGGAAKVIELQGGRHFVRKLYAMGVIPGTIIIKKSASLMKGPIVIEKGEMQFAIGYRMAQKIIVEPIED